MMARYVLRRLVYLVVILALLTVVIFGITQALPGNVARMILGSYNAPETLRALEEKLGLNDPLAVQYWRWVKRFARGDLGESLVMDRPIGPVVGEAFRNSLALAILSIVSVSVIGIGTGIVGALRHRRAADYLTSVAAFAGISLPEFFWGIVLIVLFAGYFEILPASGIGDARDDWFTWAQHLVLPVATMTLALVAHVSRQTRSNMLDVLQSNYVRAARAKGSAGASGHPPARPAERHAADDHGLGARRRLPDRRLRRRGDGLRLRRQASELLDQLIEYWRRPDAGEPCGTEINGA